MSDIFLKKNIYLQGIKFSFKDQIPKNLTQHWEIPPYLGRQQPTVCDLCISHCISHLAVQHAVNSDDEDTSDERPVLDGSSSWLVGAVVCDVRYRPVVVTELSRAAVFAETAGDLRREVTEAAGIVLLRWTTQLHVLVVQIVQHLFNSNCTHK